MEKEAFVAPLRIKSNEERQSLKGIAKEYANEMSGGALGLAASLPIGYAFGKGMQKIPAIRKSPRLAKFMQANLSMVPTRAMRAAAKKVISSTTKNPLALKRIDIATSKYIRAGARKWIGKPKNLAMLAGIMIAGVAGSYLGGKTSIRKMEKRDKLPPVDQGLITARRSATFLFPESLKPIEAAVYYGITKKYLKDKEINKTGEFMRTPEIIKEAMGMPAKGLIIDTIGGGAIGAGIGGIFGKRTNTKGKKRSFLARAGKGALVGTAIGGGVNLAAKGAYRLKTGKNPFKFKYSPNTWKAALTGEFRRIRT